MMKLVTFILVLLILFIASCSLFKPYSAKDIESSIPIEYREKVLETLDEAGDNQKELLKVLYHYKNDPQKLEAASFLIAYMPDHGYANVALVDSLGEKVPLNVMDFETAQEVQTHIDFLEKELGELQYKLIEKREDEKTITADYLINDIDLAFHAYETLPWTKQYSWEDFKEYILPYRGSTEPISNWRRYFWEEFADLRDSTNDALELAFLVNDRARKLFTFKDVFYYHPADQGLEDMLKNGYGRCEDMTNFAIYAMRANGLAITSDYTPYWPDRSNNHAWNSIVLPDGEVIPFMGSEANPGSYNLQDRIAKVYRKLFSQEKGTLEQLMPDSLKAPPWLGYSNFRDVTNKYVNVSDVKVNVDTEELFLYIAVYNDNKWNPIHWGEVVDNNSVTFTAMGRDIAYLPVSYEVVDTIVVDDEEKPQYEVIPAAAPFILTTEGIPEYFDNSPFAGREKINQEFSMHKTGHGRANKIKMDSTYTWFAWAENDWEVLADTTAASDSLVFEYYYPNSLYKVEEECLHPDPRIFTVEDGEVIFW